MSSQPAVNPAHEALDAKHDFEVSEEKIPPIETIEHVSDVEKPSEAAAPPTLTRAQRRRLYWKIDMRLLPVLTLMQLFSTLDKGMRILQHHRVQFDLNVTSCSKYW